MLTPWRVWVFPKMVGFPNNPMGFPTTNPYHEPPKPRFLDVFMVNNLVFRWPKPSFFMVLGALLEWWDSPTIPLVFLLKIINYGVFWGYHHFRKPPYDWIAN